MGNTPPSTWTGLALVMIKVPSPQPRTNFRNVNYMNCQRCGANLALVGNSHRCREVNIVNEPIVAVNAEVNKRGSYPATDKRREYMRAYMRRRRNGGPTG